MHGLRNASLVENASLTYKSVRKFDLWEAMVQVPYHTHQKAPRQLCLMEIVTQQAGEFTLNRKLLRRPHYLMESLHKSV